MTIYYTYCSYETDKGMEGLLYIGFRKCPKNKTPETDNYFGSPSSPKNLDFKNNPNKDKVILGVFDSSEEAIAHEIELHNLHDVARNPGFANQAKQTSTGFSVAGVTRSPEHCQKISESKKGKKLKPETCRKMSESRKGEKNPNYGKSHKGSSKQAMSVKRKGKNLGGDNPRFDPTLYSFRNKFTGEGKIGVTKNHMVVRHGCHRTGVLRIIRGGGKNHHKGWQLIP